jgi:hypothetical protein
MLVAGQGGESVWKQQPSPMNLPLFRPLANRFRTGGLGEKPLCAAFGWPNTGP